MEKNADRTTKKLSVIAVKGWEREGEVREVAGRWVGQKCGSSDVAVGFRVFEFEEGEWEEYADFSRMCTQLSQSL